MTEKKKIEDKLIGYSVFINNDLPAFWFDKACLVENCKKLFDSSTSGFSLPDENSKVAIFGSSILMDFASSNGRYAFDEKSLHIFESFADDVGLEFDLINELFVDNDKIYVVEINTNSDCSTNLGDDYLFKIIDGFSSPYTCVRRSAVDRFMEHKKQIVPLLVEILNEFSLNPYKGFPLGKYYNKCFVAILIVSVLREPTALYPILKIAALPRAITKRLLHPIFEEKLPVILQRTSFGSYDLIKQFVLNQFASKFCRTEAMKAILCATLDGVLKREETFDFFCSLFTGKEAESGSKFWNEVAFCIVSLYPDEDRQKVVKKCVADGLVESGMKVELDRVLSNDRSEYLKWGVSSYDMQQSVKTMENIYEILKI